MNQPATNVSEHVVVGIVQCEASDDGRAAILDLDTNSGPMRLHLARPFLHTLIGAASTAEHSERRADQDSPDLPPIVRFLRTVQPRPAGND